QQRSPRAAYTTLCRSQAGGGGYGGEGNHEGSEAGEAEVSEREHRSPFLELMERDGAGGWNRPRARPIVVGTVSPTIGRARGRFQDRKRTRMNSSHQIK